MNKLQVYNLFRESKKNIGGKLITIEGIDGSGKRTQTDLLARLLVEQGYRVKKLSFPNYEGLVGQTIASYLKGDYGDIDSIPQKIMSIVYASDRLKAKSEIEQHLMKGYVVLCDRYTYSNVFQAAKMKEEEQLDFIEWVEKLEFKEMKIPKPDFNFYLHVDYQVSVDRINSRGKREYQNGKEDIHEKNVDLLIGASTLYSKLCKNRKDWIKINQMENGIQLEQKQVFNLIKEKINDIF